MTQCPVCQTEYVEQVNYCSICGWDLTPYPPTLGQVPSAFLEKEQAKIAWAREMWAKSQSHLSEFQSKLQSQLEQLKQEREKLQFQLSQAQSQLEESEQERTLREAALTHIQGQMDQVLSRLQELVSERSPDVFAALSHLEGRLENMEAQLQALLNARRELKIRGIIKRDLDGDTLYDS